LLDLKSASESIGYRALGLKLNFQELVALNTYAIIPLTQNNFVHFAVFKGVKNNRVFTLDPLWGRLSYNIPEFQELWSSFNDQGIALVVYK
jgi:predicted double-glycine peptidase|tara:strand:+ start:437 stop:709 length:273 start_codon:yes stop_codon:yes gene_type:complete